MVSRFGTKENFLTKVNPDTQEFFGNHTEIAVMGDYPTLTDISTAYGEGFGASWLVPQLTSIALHAGAKNLTREQLRSLARVIATEYRHYKITELLIFFYRFKVGYYGKFYGTVDPMVITCALRDFAKERANMIDYYSQQERERIEQEEKAKNKPITHEEWLKIKEQQNNERL